MLTEIVVKLTTYVKRIYVHACTKAYFDKSYLVYMVIQDQGNDFSMKTSLYFICQKEFKNKSGLLNNSEEDAIKLQVLYKEIHVDYIIKFF